MGKTRIRASGNKMADIMDPPGRELSFLDESCTSSMAVREVETSHTVEVIG